MTQDLDNMFEHLIERKAYNLVEDYLEVVGKQYENYDKYRTAMFIAKAEDLTKRLVEEE